MTSHVEHILDDPDILIDGQAVADGQHVAQVLFAVFRGLALASLLVSRLALITITSLFAHRSILLLFLVAFVVAIVSSFAILAAA